MDEGKVRRRTRRKIRKIIKKNDVQGAIQILFAQRKKLGENYLSRALVYHIILKLLRKLEREESQEIYFQTLHDLYNIANPHQGEKRESTNRPTFAKRLRELIIRCSNTEDKYYYGVT